MWGIGKMWGVKIARLFFVGVLVFCVVFSCGGSFLCGCVLCAVVDSSVGGCKRKAPAFCRACVCSRGCGRLRLLVSRLLVFASCCLVCVACVAAVRWL